MLTQNYHLAFIFGVLSSLINLNATGSALQTNPSMELYQKAQLHIKLLTIPYLYGFLAIVIFYLINNLFPTYLHNYWIAGIITGLLYATFSTTTGYVNEVYGMDNYKVYLIDIIFYPLLYGVVFWFIDRTICL